MRSWGGLGGDAVVVEVDEEEESDGDDECAGLDTAEEEENSVTVAVASESWLSLRVWQILLDPGVDGRAGGNASHL